MTNLARLREAAEAFVRELENVGKSRSDAVLELDEVATSLAADGDHAEARVLKEVSEHHREATRSEASAADGMALLRA
jgi:hypothetical protein